MASADEEKINRVKEVEHADDNVMHTEPLPFAEKRFGKEIHKARLSGKLFKQF